MTEYQTQGRKIIDELKKRPMTYREMQHASTSTCPHKRVSECLRAHEKLVKGKKHMGGKQYLTTWRVVRNDEA